LLSCANNLIFRAGIAVPGEQMANNSKHGGLVRASRPKSIESMPSATGGIARLVCARLRGSGIPLRPLLSKAGLTIEQIDEPGTRLAVRSQIKLLELAADALRDDLLGFHLARDYDLRELGLLYYVLASSEILNEALDRVARYSGIVNEGVSLKFRATREAVIAMNYVGVERQSDRHHIEFWLVSLVRLCRQFANRRLLPSRIRVIHHRNRTPAELRSFLGCGIEFASDMDEIVFPATIKLMPIHSSDPYLNELLTKYCEEAPGRQGAERSTLRSSVENAMTPLLPHGKARAVEVRANWHEPLAGAEAFLGGIDLLGDFKRAEGKASQTLFEGWRSADFRDRLAAWLPRSQRIFTRLQALDRHEPETVTGAWRTGACRPNRKILAAFCRPIVAIIFRHRGSAFEESTFIGRAHSLRSRAETALHISAPVP
jgi:hypothetical protein